MNPNDEKFHILTIIALEWLRKEESPIAKSYTNGFVFALQYADCIPSWQHCYINNIHNQYRKGKSA